MLPTGDADDRGLRPLPCPHAGEWSGPCGLCGRRGWIPQWDWWDQPDGVVWAPAVGRFEYGDRAELHAWEGKAFPPVFAGLRRVARVLWVGERDGERVVVVQVLDEPLPDPHEATLR